MGYAIAVAASLLSGALYALAARILGVQHAGILAAIAVIGGGVQAIMLIVWYLLHTRPRRTARSPPADWP